MDRETVVGCVVGLVAFAAITFAGVSISYSRWHKMVAQQRSHPGWVIRQGRVTAQEQPNFTNDPPDRSSTIRFLDYYGRPEQVKAPLLYRSVVGDTVQVDVDAKGELWIPNATNNNVNGDGFGYSNVTEDPLVAHHGAWPSVGVVLTLFIAIVVGLVVGSGAMTLADALPRRPFRGRLGTR